MQWRVIVEGLGGGNPQSTMVSRALISLCHEIRLAPARGTRTHTRTTRRKVNTRLRAVNGRPSCDNYRAAAFLLVV